MAIREVVAQRGTGLHLPAVVPRQRGDVVTQPVEAQAIGEREVDPACDVDAHTARGGHFGHRQRPECGIRARDAHGK